MNTPLKNSILSLAVMSILLISCQPKHGNPELNENVAIDKKKSSLTQEEEEVKATVERLLFAAGNFNLEALDDMVLEKANLGITGLKDGIWQNSVMTVDEYLNNAKNRKLSPYYEIASHYDIQVSEGRLASVIADNIVHQFGVPKTHEINYFTLMKENGSWKFLSISFTVIPIAPEKRKFDLSIFARSYAQAWCSNRPEFVASYFSKDGSLQVNDGDPARGRAEISAIAKSFMTKFPDMNVRFDSLAKKKNGIEFHWTLTGTDADPDGKGNKVNVSGFELWTISEDGLIKDSKGNFPTEEYNKQLNLE